MDGDVHVYFNHTSNDNINFSGYYGYQQSNASGVLDYDYFSFRGTYNIPMQTNNVFKLNSSIINDYISDSYNAYSIIGGTKDFVVTPSVFFDRVSNLKVKNYYNIPDIFNDVLMNSLNVSSSMPYYSNDVSFQVQSAVFNYSIDILDRDGVSILSAPLSCQYDVMNGQSTITFNPGVNKDKVDQVVNDHNQDKNPSDPDYKNPDNYLPTVQQQPNVPSNNTNNNTTNVSQGSYSAYAQGGSVTNNIVVPSDTRDDLPNGFFTNLFNLIHGEKNTDIELLENTSGISGVMYLFEVSMSWIPPEVISIWTTFLKATLGICVGAFFLKILVNWST